jgi:hypothetical protein
LLRGAVLAVRVYDRALDAAQVAAEHHGSPLGLTRERLLAAMEADERARVRTLITRRETLAARVERLREELPEGEPTAAAWREVAHTLLMTKEFMYVR